MSRPDERAGLEALIREIAPADVATGVRCIDERDVALLLPEELATIATAVAIRRREFASGRVLLRTLIGTDRAIPVGFHRAPVVPPGYAASLAHDRHIVVAAVTQSPGVVLGIDVEPADRLEADVAALVQRSDESDVDAHLAFTLKEATYKAWSRRGGRMLDHHDVRLTVDDGSFSAEVVDDGARFDGRFTRGADRWIALVVDRTLGSARCRPTDS